MAALAAATAALTLVIPVASATAATTDPAAPAAAVVPPPLICVFLQRQIQFATLIGNPLLANLLGRVVVLLGCPH
jgi:hypothetical protein